MVKLKENLCYYILVLSVLLFGTIMAALYSVSIVSNGLVFSLYTLVGMLLPGYAFVNLLKIDCRTDIELIAYTIFFGYFISFLEYFLVVPFRIQDYAPFVWMFFSVISLVYLFVRNKKMGLVVCGQRDNFGIRACIIIFFVVVFIRCGIYAGENLLPYGNVKQVNLFEDLLYWIGNTVELTKRFPPHNFRSYGSAFNYHYFTSVQLAMTSLSTGISPALISFCFSYIYPSAMLVFGGYLAFSKLTTNNWLRVGGMFAFLFTSGFSDLTDNRYAGFMYEYPFAYEYGVAILLFLSFLVMNEFYKEKITIKDAGVIGAFFILLCGVKANSASLALCGIGMCCIRWILHKETRKKAIVLGLSALGIFIVLYFFVTNLRGYSGTVAAAFMKSNVLTNGGSYGDGRLVPFYEGMLNHKIPVFLAGLIYAIVYTFLSNPLVFGLLFYQLIWAAIKRKRLADGSLCLLVVAAVGIFIKIFIGMGGWSEQYFMYNAIPFAVMFVVLNYETEHQKGRVYVAKSAAIVVLAILSIYGFIKYDGKIAFVRDTIGGFSRYVGSDYVGDYQVVMTKKQFEAYEWLSKEAGREDLVTTNRQGIATDVGCFTQCNVVGGPVGDKPVSWAVYVKEDGGDLRDTYKDLGFVTAFENEEVEILRSGDYDQKAK